MRSFGRDGRAPKAPTAVGTAGSDPWTQLAHRRFVLPGRLFQVGGAKPSGPRAALFTDERYKTIAVLVDLMRKIGGEHGGKSPAQVALNWCICKGTLPIPGAKTAAQVEEIAGAFGWRLTEGEVAELDAVSAKVPPSTGAPFEKW